VSFARVGSFALRLALRTPKNNQKRSLGANALSVVPDVVDGARSRHRCAIG
jgi:hypothetical protein